MILPLVRLTRPYYCLPLSAGLLVITTYVTGGRRSVVDGSLVPACLALYSVLSAAYLLNDFCDIHADAVDHQRRVLPSKQLAPSVAWIASACLFVLGLALASFGGWGFFLLLTLVAMGLVAYDIFSKRLGMFKAIVVAMLTNGDLSAGVHTQRGRGHARLYVLWIHPLWLFATTVGYEMLKDIRDIRGDSLSGGRYRARRTPPDWLLASGPHDPAGGKSADLAPVRAGLVRKRLPAQLAGRHRLGVAVASQERGSGHCRTSMARYSSSRRGRGWIYGFMALEQVREHRRQRRGDQVPPAQNFALLAAEREDRGVL